MAATARAGLGVSYVTAMLGAGLPILAAMLGRGVPAQLSAGSIVLRRTTGQRLGA